MATFAATGPVLLLNTRRYGVLAVLLAINTKTLIKYIDLEISNMAAGPDGTVSDAIAAVEAHGRARLYRTS